jgi:hypothetical protein
MRKIFIYTLIILFSLTSCNKFLDTTPDNRTEIDSPTKVAQLIAASYPQSNYSGLVFSRVDFISDKGPGFTEQDRNTDSFFWRDMTSTSQDSPEYYWQRCYYGIAEVNHATEAASVMDQDVVKASLAEGKIVRAWSHFMLAMVFCKMYDKDGTNDSQGIPYVKDVEKVVVKQYDRGTVKDVYENIEKDLLEGYENLGKDANYSVPKYHFTRAAASAFATRFYLFKSDWDNVIKFANNVIPTPQIVQDGNVPATDPANVYCMNNFQPWLTTFANAASSTDIKIGYSAPDNGSNLLVTENVTYLPRYTNSWRYSTKKVDTDATVAATNVTTGTWAYRVYSSGDSYYYPKFYEFFYRTSLNASTGTIMTMFPFLRNEEVLLNRAEAYAMKDNIPAAIADLNVFCRQRIRAYDESAHVITIARLLNFYSAAIDNPDHFLAKYNAYNSSGWSAEKKAVILCILDFRRNEFMYEGLRYWDMIRYRIPSVHTTFDGRTNTLYPGDDRWVFQIPESAKLSGVTGNPRENYLSPLW